MTGVLREGNNKYQKNGTVIKVSLLDDGCLWNGVFCLHIDMDAFEYWQENEHGHDLQKEGYAIRRKCLEEWKICINYG